MLSSSLNDYSNFIKLENSLLLANDRIKSLECLLASKDFTIYHMSICNAYMAQSLKPPYWRPPLPSDFPPQKECNEFADDCTQSSASSVEFIHGKFESASIVGHLPKQVSQVKRNPAGDSKPSSNAIEPTGAVPVDADADNIEEAIFVESQMRHGGGGGLD